MNAKKKRRPLVLLNPEPFHGLEESNVAYLIQNQSRVGPDQDHRKEKLTTGERQYRPFES